MPKLRRLEEAALSMIALALDTPVIQNDDGTAEGMHDLAICYPDGAWGAVEVTSAADGDSIAVWNLLNGRDRWIDSRLAGGWSVVLSPLAPRRLLKREIPALLQELETSGRTYLRPSCTQNAVGVEAHGLKLGILYAFQGGTDFPGSIYPTVDQGEERSGGCVDERSSDAVAGWVGPFLSDNKHSDVLAKLARSGADERHAFLIVPGMSTVDFSVNYALIRTDPVLPTFAPVLPVEVTNVWVVSTSKNGCGLRWSPDGWSTFEKVVRPDHRGSLALDSRPRERPPARRAQRR